MEAPSEFEHPPPRDVKLASSLFKKQRAIATTCLVGGALVAVAFMLFGRVVHGSLLYQPVVAFGVAGFIWLGAALMLMNMAVAKRVFRDGVVLEAQVTKITRRDGPAGRAAFTVRGTFADTDGAQKAFLVSTFVQVTDIGCREGDVIPVLHLANRPAQLVVYLPGLGMMMAPATSAPRVPA